MCVGDGLCCPDLKGIEEKQGTEGQIDHQMLRAMALHMLTL